MSTLKVFCDGGSRGNPGPAAAGVVVYEGGTRVAEYNKYLGTQTNNFAEYSAVLLALDKIVQFNPNHIDFYLDSELVVKQLTGVYRVKNANIKPLYDAVTNHALYQLASFAHVYRSDNKEADAMVNKALDEQLA